VQSRQIALSQRIATKLLDVLNAFNLARRQSQARSERQFIEDRLAAARAESRVAENRLQNFLTGNRTVFNSPVLQFEQQRLQRDVTITQQVLLTLTQSFEQARIEEVRDTPVITIIEPPNLPVDPQPRGLVKGVLAALVAGVVLAALWAVGFEALRRVRATNVRLERSVTGESRASVA
jgi:uncharacterized protein involved in exopolysaccharide biosynthesis